MAESSSSGDDEISRLVKQFNLVDHPEGGYFQEMFRADRQINFVKATRHGGSRDAGTSIYYLLKAPNFTSWHQVLSDELFFWHAGGPAKLHFIDTAGNHSYKILGDGLRDPSYVYQILVPHDTWYAAELIDDTSYVLFSAVVIPGFEYKDWIQGERETMLKEFPQHSDLIKQLTKK